MPLARRAPRLLLGRIEQREHQPLRFAHREIAVHHARRRRGLLRRRQREHRAGMAHFHAAVEQILLRRLRERRQPQQVGDGAARAADGLRRRFVRQAEFVDQPLQADAPLPADSGPRAGCFRSATARAPTWSGTLLDERGHLGEPRALRRAPAPFAGDDLEAAAVDRAAPGSAASVPVRESNRRVRSAPFRPCACAAGTCPA